MPQESLPLLPEGSTEISSIISVHRGDCHWTYFCGMVPVFIHEATDLCSFRMFTSQLYCEGRCKQSEIIGAFGVSKTSVKRAVKKYREGGISSFYNSKKTREGTVITKESAPKIQSFLDKGYSRSFICKKMKIKKSTLTKAIQQKRLSQSITSTEASPIQFSNKSERSQQDKDSSSEMGVACTRPIDRALASMGKLAGGATTHFENSLDVSFGGLLCALPALDKNGLFKHLHTNFTLPDGYYKTVHIFLLIAYMSLARIKTVECLRYQSPGELGKVMGLDRIPEVKCLREKLSLLSKNNAPDKWASALSKQWMNDEVSFAGTLYIDGHVRVYHGSKTKIPKKHISRQRLCLRGVNDYWVNDAIGRPYFSVERVVDDGMLKVLSDDIIPRLLKDVPNQPSDKDLENNVREHRLLLVFDREGYSPEFFKKMWVDHRIACMTYKKFQKESWSEKEFISTTVKSPNGEVSIMKLAERGSWIGEKNKGLWVREIRKLSEKGYQTSIITTAYNLLFPKIAASMFSRWCQENFFRYMRQHYDIDGLYEHSLEKIPDTQKVINPEWSSLNFKCQKLTTQLQRSRSIFAELTMHPEESDEKKKEKSIVKMANIVEDIEYLENNLLEIKKCRKEQSKHICMNELPEDKQFKKLSSNKKRLIDSIKMIAYRAETAMASLIRPIMSRSNDARSLLCDIFRSDADISSSDDGKYLNISLHYKTNNQANEAVATLLETLNESEYCYPGTTMQLRYSLGRKY